MRSVESRFWRHVQKAKPNQCWLWTGFLNRQGYGHLTGVPDRDGVLRYTGAHRVSYYIHHGFPPEDKPHVLHRCDNPTCVNPRHLYSGTNSDNMKDKSARGRVYVGDRRGVRNSAAILDEETVVFMRELRELGCTWKAIGDYCGVSLQTAANAVQGKSWSHVSGAVKSYGRWK